MKFFIIATGYNCAGQVEACYNSLLSLEGNYNYKALLIDDGSTDESLFNKMVALKELKPCKRINIGRSESNHGAARQRFEAIKKSNLDEEDVIILLGLDDYLLPNALYEIHEQYTKGKWMTYGNWISQFNEMLPDGFLEFPDEVHNERSYRRERYRSTAPNTFKKFLFDQFTEDDFIFRGEWIKATTESNLMLSCLEMCGKERIGLINEPIYLYNKDRLDNAKFRFGRHYQDDIYKWVKNKPKRDLLIR